MNRFLGILLALICSLAAYHFALQKGFVNPYPVVCDLVAKKVFLSDDKIKKWKRICHRRSRLVTPYSPKKLIIKDINNTLGLLNVSHLEVYDTSEVRSIWKGEALDTGIESEFVDSELVIFKVQPQSPAALQGLRRGDVIKSINRQQPNPWEARSEKGSYVMQRAEKEWTVQLKTGLIERDEKMTVEKLNSHKAVLRVPSFRSTFFSDAEMQRVGKELDGIQNLVVDLRGNAGGNFVAGLRLLSMLLCSPKEIGRLLHPRLDKRSAVEMPNDLDDDKQLQTLDRNGEVILKTFTPQTCYRGVRSVLVDGKTASVAEMVAQALKEFSKAPLLGVPSRGQLLVGVWYSLEEVGHGVKISIPEAVYLSAKGYQIEGQGVNLDKMLYYNLTEMQTGVDSWVKKALD